MSASRTPTAAPLRASARARLMVTVDLPTPPLPAPTRTMFFTPGVIDDWATPGADRTRAPKRRSTRDAPAPRRAASTSLAMASLSGHAGVVSSTCSEAIPPSTLRSFTIPRLTRSRCSSGSITLRSAAVALSSVISMGAGYSRAAGAWQDALMLRVERLEGNAVRTGGRELAAPGAAIWVDCTPEPENLDWLAARFG